jgi:hypothetical protein
MSKEDDLKAEVPTLTEDVSTLKEDASKNNRKVSSKRVDEKIMIFNKED